MAGRIQGITVEIDGDTTKLQTALKGVNTETSNIVTTQMYIDGYQVKLVSDTSYGSLWNVSFTLKGF